MPPHAKAMYLAAKALDPTLTETAFLAARSASMAAAAAAEAAARAPHEMGLVARHALRRRTSSGEAGAGGGAGRKAATRRHHTSSSERRRRGRRVTMANRRLRVNLNTGLGFAEIHPSPVEPGSDENTRGAAYRLKRRSPAINVTNAAAVEAYAQRTRRKTLDGVMGARANATEAGVRAAKLTAINAALADLAERASLNASNAMAIEAIGEQLRALLEASSSE